jgi:hypothetical protein
VVFPEKLGHISAVGNNTCAINAHYRLRHNYFLIAAPNGRGATRSDDATASPKTLPVI